MWGQGSRRSFLRVLGLGVAVQLCTLAKSILSHCLKFPPLVNLCCVPATERGVDSFQASFVYDEVQPTTEGFRGTALWTLGLWFMFSLCFYLFSLHCQWSRHLMYLAQKLMHSTLQWRWKQSLKWNIDNDNSPLLWNQIPEADMTSLKTTHHHQITERKNLGFFFSRDIGW